MAILTSKVNMQQPDALFEFTHGIPQDKRLAKQEVAVQLAWLNGLSKLGMFSEAEVLEVTNTLQSALNDIDNEVFEWSIRDEDIHMHLEKYVTERLGIIGKKMHLGRSRNDLIATTLRLYTNDVLTQVEEGLNGVCAALSKKAEETVDVIVPGLTHLQHGQPVRFAHIMLSYVEQFKRDLNKVKMAQATAMSSMPLGAAALAGTPLDLDLQAIASELGFDTPTANSYDAVGDRDFMLEALNACASIGIHLARLSEDAIYWSATSVGLVKLPQAWSTGSSIMPNKRNPDVPELTRGRSAHMLSAQNDGHILMRTVPTSYGSDLHELKKVLMRAVDEALACLKVWPHFIEHMNVDAERAAQLCNEGHILATEVADDLVEHGVPFRDAYKVVAELVRQANEGNMQVHELPLDIVNAVIQEAGFNPVTEYSYTPEQAVNRRSNTGGTSKDQVLSKI